MNIVRGILVAILSLVLLVVLAGLAVIANGWRLMHPKALGPAAAFTVTADSALFARGEHLVRISCASCHSGNAQPPLSGGEGNFIAELHDPQKGQLWAPNLTPAGPLKNYSDGDIARAIREGYSRNGRPLLVMPSASYHRLADRDVAALITFLRRQPAVERSVPDRKMTALTYLILGLKIFPPSSQPPIERPIAGPPAGATVGHGDYLVSLLDCRTCHGPGLRGGKPGIGPPAGPDLIAIFSAHDSSAFEKAVRHGTSARDGHSLDPNQMPYAVFAKLDDVEIGALYAYVKSLTGKP
jgi:mono/diheme cytochrome c family protein